MYMTDTAHNQEDVNNIRQAMKSAKGAGQFSQPVYLLVQR